MEGQIPKKTGRVDRSQGGDVIYHFDSCKCCCIFYKKHEFKKSYLKACERHWGLWQDEGRERQVEYAREQVMMVLREGIADPIPIHPEVDPEQFQKEMQQDG